MQQTALTHETPWLIRPRPQQTPALRLFCFPYGGGGAAAYRPWAAALPQDVELNLIQLPGRENRWRETPYTRMAAVVDEVAPVLAAIIASAPATPYAFFGHSMGSFLAFESARALRRTGAALPVCLFASGRRAPQAPESESPMHVLDDEAFVAAIVRRYNAIPQAILDDAEMLKLYLPALRADLEMIETYVYRDEPPLSCPIVALGGFDDPRASVTDLAAWRMQTSSWFQMRQFAGDHFYLQAERAALLGVILDALTTTEAFADDLMLSLP